MLTRSAAPILLCCFLFGSSLQAPSLIPENEDCPHNCVCKISDGKMEVHCLTDDEFKAIDKPSPEEDLAVYDEIELVKPISNSDTAPEETASDGPQALNASFEEDEKSKQQNISEPRIVIESAIAVDIDEKLKENEIESDKLPLDEEMMQADEQHTGDENQPPSDDDLKEGEKEFPETLVSDPDSKVVAKKGTHLHPIKEEEWQRDQAPEDSYEEYDEVEIEKPEEKDAQKSKKNEEDKSDEKTKLQEEVEKQKIEEDEKPVEIPVSIEETVQNRMDNENKKENISENENDNEKEIGVSLEESEVTPLIPVEQAVESKEDTPTEIETENRPLDDKNQALLSAEEEETSVDTENKDNNNESDDGTVVRALDNVEETGNKQPVDAVKEDGDAYDSKEPVVVAEDKEISIRPNDIKEEEIDTENNSNEESTERGENVPLIKEKSKQDSKENDKSSSLENVDGDSELKSNEKESEEQGQDDNNDDETIQQMEVDGIPIVLDNDYGDSQDELTTPTAKQEETEEEVTEKVVVNEESKNQTEIEPPNVLIVTPDLINKTDDESKNQTEIEPPNILIVTPDLINKTDDEKNITDVVASRSRQNTNDKGPDNYILPDGEILVNGDIDNTMTGKIIDEKDEESTETTQPQQSTASWVILGLILGTFVVVLGYAAIRGSINKKKEAEITADSKTSNSIPPVFDPKFIRKPDFETGTELKELSRPFLQPSEEPVREFKDKKDDLDEVVVNGIDMSTGLPYIDAPNPLFKQQRPNVLPLDLPAPNDTSRHDSTTTSPSTEPSAPELQQHTPTTPTLVRTRIVDNSPQIPRMISNDHVIDDD